MYDSIISTYITIQFQIRGELEDPLAVPFDDRYPNQTMILIVTIASRVAYLAHADINVELMSMSAGYAAGVTDYDIIIILQ